MGDINPALSLTVKNTDKGDINRLTTEPKGTLHVPDTVPRM